MVDRQERRLRHEQDQPIPGHAGTTETHEAQADQATQAVYAAEAGQGDHYKSWNGRFTSNCDERFTKSPEELGRATCKTMQTVISHCTGRVADQVYWIGNRSRKIHGRNILPENAA